MTTILTPGTLAPDFTLPVAPDKQLTLSGLRGKPVILAFYPADEGLAEDAWKSLQRLAKVCVVRDSSEETPFDEACVDLLIPCGSETMTKCVGVIERVDGGHHVNDGLCAEPGDGGASVVLKFVGDVAKNRPQALAFA